MDYRGVPPMVFSGNIAENWKFWKQRFLVYLQATEICKKEGSTKCAQLLTLIGEEGLRIFNTFKIVEEEKNNLEYLLTKFEEYFAPKRNLTYERHKLLTCKQKEGQSIENFVTELKNFALSSELGDLEDGILKDLLICGVSSKDLREKLLLQDVTTLEEAVKVCVNATCTIEHNRIITNGSSNVGHHNEEIGEVRKTYSASQTSRTHQWHNGGPHQQLGYQKYRKPTHHKSSYRSPACGRCGTQHTNPRSCPAYGKTCGKCGKVNHFASVCKTPFNHSNYNKSSKFNSQRNFNRNKKSINLIENDTADEFLFVDLVAEESGAGATNGDSSWSAELEIKGHNVNFKLDTGADADVIPFEKESNDIEQLLNDTLSEKVPEEDLRLPKLIYPINYRLWIHPIIDEYAENNFTFTGRVKILINCTSKTDKIVLNIDDLNITDSDVKVSTTKQVELKFKPLKEETHNVSRRAVDSEDNNNNNNDSDPSGESTEEPTASTTDDETTVSTTTEENIQTTTEQILIHTEEIPLTIDKIEKDPENFKLTIVMKYLLEENHLYTVDIKFFGEIINNLVGLYKTSYTDLSGKKKWLATTHMQSVYARRVFPCFDEPSFKATFEISVARRTNMTALSNMPLQETEPMNATEGWVWDHFQKSPPMSTYIVAFTVCDFDNLSANPSSGTAIRVWAPKDDVPKTKYALEVTQEILKFLEKYFAMEYPLPKLDMVAVPNFGKEAMENWGLISFRKSSILFDPNSRSIKTKSFIFSKIAHELTHQWFGNLVTMDWWSDLWLNEGFGTFMAEVAVTSLRPLWHSTSTLQLRDMYKTLYFDSLKTTRSIQTQISSTSEIEQIFDTITYQKGSSVLKMLNFTITRPVFKKGLRDYLKKYSYTTATQDDLWEIFTETAHNKTTLPQNVTVKQLMNSWTTQSGYPYLTVFRNYSDQTALLNQTKMVEDTNSTESNSLWFVPVTYITKEDLDVKNVWLGNIRKTELDLNGTSNNSWILLNIDETGFYRVNYDKRNWKLLQAQLRENPNKIPISNRGQLIDDAFQLARIAVINYTVAFDLVKYLNYRETNYIPWYAALRNMEELRVIMSNYEYDGLYDSFLLKLIKPVFDKLSVNEKNLTQTEKLLQLHIFTSACKLRYSKCISWAKEQYRKWMNMSDPDKKNPIPVDYRFIVQCSAIKSSGPDEWDFLWNRTLSPKISPNDLQTAYLSLGCSYDPWIINRYLEYSLDGNITLENVPFVWKSISHPVGVRTGFQFLRLNWDRIFDTYEDIYLVFSTIFHDFVSGLSTEIDLEDLTTFYKLHQNDLKSVSGILQSTVDQMKVKINWKKIHLDSVVNWLRQNKY